MVVVNVPFGGLPGPLLVLLFHASALAALGFAAGSALAHRARLADRTLPAWAEPVPLALGCGAVGAVSGVLLALSGSSYRVPPLLGTVLFGVFAGAASAAAWKRTAAQAALLRGAVLGGIAVVTLVAFVSMPQRLGPLATFGATGALAGWVAGIALRPITARRGTFGRRLAKPFAVYGALIAMACRSVWLYIGWTAWDLFLLILIGVAALIACVARLRRVLRPYADYTTHRRGRVGGFEIHYLTLGEGNGPLLVLLHGFLSKAFEWLGVSRLLVKKGFRVAIVDAPWGSAGIGLPRRGRVLPQFEKFFWAVLDLIVQDHQPAEGGRKLKVVLVAHSFGGGFARWLAREDGLPIDGLVLLNPAGHHMGRAARIMGKRLVAPLVAIPGVSEAVWLLVLARARLRGRDPLARPSGFSARLQERGAARTAAVVGPPMMYELFRVAATGTAPGVPTVECYSERDKMVLVSSTERVPRGPEIHVPPPMPGGHSPHREDPEGVAALIADAVEYVLRARRRPTAATPGDGSATLLRGGAEPDGEVTQMVTWATGVLAGLRRPSGRTLAAGAVLAGAAAAAAGVALGRRAPRAD
jgi:pimeloyl-ACP methyl ester carboxylesterase